MYYQIDWSRLLGVLLLLGAGTFLATRLAGAAPSSGSSLAPTRASRIALGGMWLMTLLGLGTGVAGALLENVLGQSAVVLLLHGMYGVCWAPVSGMHSLQQALAAGDIATRFLGDVFSLLGVLLVPVFWFAVFLGVAHVVGRRRGSP